MIIAVKKRTSTTKTEFDAADFARAYELFVTNDANSKIINYGVVVSKKKLSYNRNFSRDFDMAKKILKLYDDKQQEKEVQEFLRAKKFNENCVLESKKIYNELLANNITFERLDNYILERNVRTQFNSYASISRNRDMLKLKEIYKNCGIEGRL